MYCTFVCKKTIITIHRLTIKKINVKNISLKLTVRATVIALKLQISFCQDS